MSEQAFDGFCKDQGYEGGVTLVGTDIDAYSIRCKNSNGSLEEYDKPEDIHNFVTAACQWTYPGVSRTDRLATMAKTYTAWECVNFGGYEGIPDFTKWCESKGLQLINREDVKYPAYRWFCANSAKSRVEGIPVDKVCESQYGEDTLDRVFNVYAEKVGDAWDCFWVGDEKG
ncbi:hypothetical protein OG930_12945 [Streptomyces sp. NBC_01799]|nr:hypothetical protein OG930_12945 [Streptomyces sp. NBC_01799]